MLLIYHRYIKLVFFEANNHSGLSSYLTITPNIIAIYVTWPLITYPQDETFINFT
jgi:hypothetical protein